MCNTGLYLYSEGFDASCVLNPLSWVGLFFGLSFEFFWVELSVYFPFIVYFFFFYLCFNFRPDKTLINLAHRHVGHQVAAARASVWGWPGLLSCLQQTSDMFSVSPDQSGGRKLKSPESTFISEDSKSNLRT